MLRLGCRNDRNKIIGAVRVCVCLLDRGVVGVETFYHPLNRIWHDQDGVDHTWHD